jgi:hypothetical protein
VVIEIRFVANESSVEGKGFRIGLDEGIIVGGKVCVCSRKCVIIGDGLGEKHCSAFVTSLFRSRNCC